tara:strand:+ start:5920 stop:8328 length:2409 start_codon:yes stop_codon:yes gene_type:complete
MSLPNDAEIRKLNESGLFDSRWYLDNYPDVNHSGMDAASHFLWIGYKIGRKPSKEISNSDFKNLFFNEKESNDNLDNRLKSEIISHDIDINSGVDDSLLKAIKETRLFNDQWYRDKYQISDDQDALIHFAMIGLTSGFDPSESFSSVKYMAAHTDVSQAGMTAFQHYLAAGRAEYRPIFAHNILDNYKDVIELSPDKFFIKQREKKSAIAVVVHVFYPEIWPEVVEYLRNIEEEFDLYISLIHGKSEKIESSIKAMFPDAHVLVFPNHGRDVFPFTEFLSAGVLDGYELVCKIHTKRSLHRADGDAWRRQLYDGLLGSTDLVRKICAHMRRNPDVGLLVPDGYIFGAESMGSNAEALSKLMKRMHLHFDLEKLTFPAGNMFWASATTIQFLKALNLSIADYELEGGQLDATLGHAIERFVGVACAKAAQTIITTSDVLKVSPIPYDGKDHKLIAFYLPQYHPIPENDRWWGKGFTEWRNVEKAVPSFDGHIQPRRPADLGYYDLRVAQIQVEQTEMAKKYGIDAFCYYHYWFDGKKMLDLPIENMIANDEIDFPFCICWANENWTRSWDGLNRDVLMPQTYDENMLAQYPRDVYKYLSDRRYLKYNGKPVFLIYKIMDIPNPSKTLDGWRKTWKKLGLGDVHIAAVRTFPNQNKVTIHELGVDAFVDFPPHSIHPFVKPAAVTPYEGFEGYVYDYDSGVEGDLDRYEREDSTYVHRGVMGCWDNSARRGTKAQLAYGASPITYRSWLRRSLLQDADSHPGMERLTFINAWNEWAEGTYLEPDQHYGIAFLEATRSVRAIEKA